MASNDLIVRIFGDTKGLEQSFARANQATAQFGRNVTTVGAKVDKASKSFKGLAAGAGAGFAGAFVASEAIRGIKSAIDVASNLNEQMSKSNVVFESAAKDVSDWSKTTADAFGIARDQALEAASTFGSMFDAAGASSEDAARLSKNIVELAGDLASFNNTSTDDALTALRSGLSGEIEPLRRFQVFLTEAAVAQQAMADTGKTSADQLTQGEKILARYALILKGTVKAQGDAARTSESYANQTKRLAANMRDLQSQIGGPLLTVVNHLAGDLISGADAVQKLNKNLQDLSNVVVPVIEIPLRLVGLDDTGKGDKGGDIDTLKKSAKALVTSSLPGIVGLLDDAIRGEGIFGPGKKPNENELANEFAKNYTPFLDGLKKGAKKVGDEAASTGKKVASFGDPGFKALGESVKTARDSQFRTALAGLEGSLDRAEIDDALGNDLSALRALAAGLQGAIAAGTDVAKNQKRLAVVLGQIGDVQQSIKDDNAAKFIEPFLLAVDIANNTEFLKDDVEALKDYAGALRSLIAQGQDVAANQRTLVGVIGEIGSKQDEINKRKKEAAAKLKQSREFKALGLTVTGEEPIPGAENLTKRITGLLNRAASGQVEVSSKMVGRLKAARALLKKEGDKLNDDTKNIINDWIKTVSQGAKKVQSGPLTKTQGLNADKVLAGLGLSPEQQREARARLSSVNTAGRSLAGDRRPTGGFQSGVPVVIQNETTVRLDNDVVGRSVTKTQQKQRRRNPVQKRGPNSGG